MIKYEFHGTMEWTICVKLAESNFNQIFGYGSQFKPNAKSRGTKWAVIWEHNQTNPECEIILEN